MRIFGETDRLLLREIVEEDAKGIFALDSDPEVHKYLGKKPITSMKQAENVVQYIRKQYHDHGIGRWAVVEKSTNEFMGWSGLKYETEVHINKPYYDIGYRLLRKYWGQGIATETARIALNYGFEQLKLEEICGGAHVENIASNKILKKIGLHLQEDFEYDGEMHHWYTIRRDQWFEHLD